MFSPKHTENVLVFIGKMKVSQISDEKMEEKLFYSSLIEDEQELI